MWAGEPACGEGAQAGDEGCPPLSVSWEGAAELQAGDVLIVRIDDARLRAAAGPRQVPADSVALVSPALSSPRSCGPIGIIRGATIRSQTLRWSARTPSRSPANYKDAENRRHNDHQRYLDGGEGIIEPKRRL
ncbi:Protein of unknown function [Gryllus bimaculatus]|nr:Protein of unknown function [Gryllus bimaculatus]